MHLNLLACALLALIRGFKLEPALKHEERLLEVEEQYFCDTKVLFKSKCLGSWTRIRATTSSKVCFMDQEHSKFHVTETQTGGTLHTITHIVQVEQT